LRRNLEEDVDFLFLESPSLQYNYDKSPEKKSVKLEPSLAIKVSPPSEKPPTSVSASSVKKECKICLTDDLSDRDTFVLECGHEFHLDVSVVFVGKRYLLFLTQEKSV